MSAESALQAAITVAEKSGDFSSWKADAEWCKKFLAGDSE